MSSMKKEDHVMGTTFVDVITQCSWNLYGTTILPVCAIEITEFRYKNHFPHPLIIFSVPN